MRRFFGLLGIPFLLIGLIWLGAVIYLQQSGMDVSGQTLLNSFVLIPLAAICLWFAAKAAYSAFTRPPAAAASTDTAEASAPPAPPKKIRALAILSAEIQTFADERADQLLPAILEGQLQPSLSAELSNSEGLPLMAALHPGLETDEARLWLERWLATSPPEHPARSADAEEGARLAALLEAPLARTLDALASLPPLPPTEQRPGTSAPQRPLMVKLFAPDVWQDMLAAMLREQLSTLEGYVIGMVRPDPQRAELHHDALRVAGAFGADLRGTPPHPLLLLVACDSLAASACIERLEQDGQLFAATRQSGLIPGEAAALVLLAPADQPFADAEPLARLAHTAWGARQKPVNAGGRSEAELLASMLPSLLEQSGVGAAEICKLASDCDQRAAWNAEAASLISAELRELDPFADHLAFGRAFGCTGQASPLLALALAATHVRDEARAVLLASLSDPIQRSLAVLAPWSAPAT